MMKYIIILSIVLVGYACQNKSISFDGNKIDIKMHEINEVSIHHLLISIDSIYGFKNFKLDSIRLDTISEYYKKFKIVNEDNDSGEGYSFTQLEEPLYAFDPEKAEFLYKYGPFSMLEFNNDSIAKLGFMKVFELFKNEKSWIYLSGDSIELFYDVFTKGGSTYFYKGNVIIHKYRECNDDYKEQELKENMIINFLYANDSVIDNGYFMRYCCSCPDNEGKEYK